MLTRGLTRLRARTLWIAALTVAALYSATDLRAQLPMPAATPFEMTGFIQTATLDAGADPFRGGTITLNNHKVIVPRNTIFQMPATSVTWAELFTEAPAPYGPAQTGLALNDTPKPPFTFEVIVQGNRVGDDYIAGLLFINQLSMMAHQGFVNFIDYGTGEMRVGGTPGVADGTRVRLNDPIGRYGRAGSHDRRFTVDEDNPTVKSETGFPMCVPRGNPAVADDVLCPQGNRPTAGTKYQSIFTMPVQPTPTTAEYANNGATRTTPDPWRMAPFEVGDYVTVKGPIVFDAAGQYVDAWGVDANVGIFTTPGTQPFYVAIDVLLMGTGPLDDLTLAQEGAKRTRVEGFTTDISTAVKISAVDVDACTGEEVDRVWNLQAVDPGPPNGAVAGRWRFRPGAPLFDLKGFPFLPPTREVRAVGLAGTVPTLNGLNAGAYQAPNFEFILPENRGIGNPKVAANFDAMPFLAQGSGPRDAFGTRTRLGFVSQLSPWPDDPARRPIRNACAPIASAGTTQTVSSAATVTLDGSASSDANTPASPITFAWTQTAGPAVALSGANTAKPTFNAPTLAVGAASATLTFQLTVSNGATASSASVNVIVVAPADTVKPTVGTVTTNPVTLLKAKAATASVVATDNAAVTSVTFLYSYTANGVKQTGTVIGAKAASPANTWTGSFTMPNVTGTFTFTAVATDAAGNSTTSAVTSKSVTQ
ncbi:MAG: hypothetical protein JWL71_1574 [Acidobacteria bacterium]|nr:hypothetical protein [Acidobacteriota bacterium]